VAHRTIAGSRSLVTGASGGIGRAIALELGRLGARVVALARREEPLQTLADAIRAAGGEAEAVVGDVTDPAVRRAALERAQQRFGGLDVLVNNAGVGALGRFEHAEPDVLRRLFEVNFFAAAEMIREALPLLKQGRKPIVVNVSSILGHRGLPRMSEYCATKFALAGLSEALRAEFVPQGIDMLVVSPGTTESEFFDHVVDKHGGAPWPRKHAVPAEAVARATVKAIRRGSHEIIPNNLGRLLCWANRISPWLVDQFMARYS